MSAVFYELIDGASGSITKDDGQSVVKEVRRHFVAGQFSSLDDCFREVEPYAPPYWASDDGWWVRTNLTMNGIGNRYFDVTATYRTLVPQFGGDGGGGDGGGGPQFVPGSVAWDTTGNREHMTMAIAQERFPDNDAPDFEGAINVVGNAVQGIDVVRPAMRYSETWILPADLAMDCDYLGAVYSLTGTVNMEPFRCFAPGEALFLGARGQWQEDQPYVAVTFEFEARPNDDEYYPWIGYGGHITKEGWEYFWLLYEDGVDANTIIKRPIAGYKCQLYHKRDWAPLQIGSQTIGGPADGRLPQSGAAGGGSIGP